MDFVIGEVLSAGAGGLSILAEGNAVTREDMYINEALLPGYSPQLAGTLKGKGYDSADVTVKVQAGQLTRATSPLEDGDRVVLLTQDHQTYYLLCKAVRYG